MEPTLHTWLAGSGLRAEWKARLRFQPIPVEGCVASLVWFGNELFLLWDLGVPRKDVLRKHVLHLSPKHIVEATEAENVEEWAARFAGGAAGGEWIHALMRALFDGPSLPLGTVVGRWSASSPAMKTFSRAVLDRHNSPSVATYPYSDALANTYRKEIWRMDFHRTDSQRTSQTSCATCGRGPQETTNAKDPRFKICNPCSASWDRIWNAGDLATFASGHIKHGRMCRVVGNSSLNSDKLVVEYRDGEDLVEIDLKPWWLRPVPTLFEWLKDSLSDLGKWTDVLRKYPIPGGRIKCWEFREPNIWHPNEEEIGYAPMMVVHLAQGHYLRPQHDVLFGAFFIRHPDEKPEEKRTQVYCEDQYEVLP